jgi:hypothetical protein
MALRIYAAARPAAEIGNAAGFGGAVRLFAPDGDKLAVSLQGHGNGSGKVHVFAAGEEEAVLLDGEKKSLVVQAEAGAATLGNRGGSWGLFLGPKEGIPVAEIAQPEGKGMALRLFEQGTQIAALGSAPGQGGAIRIFASDGTAAVGVNATPEGGLVQAFRAGKGGAALVGQEPAVVVYNDAGTGVASLSLSKNAGGNVSVSAPDGTRAFAAGSTANGLGEACVWRMSGGGPKTHCLGIGLPGMGSGN